ncbi:ABC transporter substrate-binding protein [Nocardioides insulae]|uniref:ABC transporter substrate-binding protein n=1 Tax=Nocardioides insulae TaxID=394734 RepID=UPI00042A571C|nr:ABC transporter substrate-binding protein [Nocardioides insulae]
MRRLIGAAVVAALVAGTAACGGSSGGAASGGSTDSFTLAAITPPSSFAIGAMASSGPEDPYYQAVYDRLLSVGTDGQPQADLATEWAVGDNGMSLDLTLREGVTFTDGAAFDAAAVKANLEKAKAAKGEAGSALGAVQSVKVVDPTHVSLKLNRPDPGLTAALARSSGYMASPQALDSADLATQPVGSGPYVLDSKQSTAGSVYVYTRNEDYWDKEAFPYDTLTIRFLEDMSATVNGLRSGQIDATATQTSDLVAAAEQADLNVETFFGGGLDGMYLWDRDGKLAPALKDVRVRQAINYATNRDAILESVKGGLGTVTSQVFPEGSLGYDEALDDAYPYDLDKAKQLMAEAGYADGFSITLPDFSPVYPDEQAAMTELLKSINITVEYKPTTGDQVVGSIMGGQWPLNYFTLTTSSPYELIGLTMTDQSPFNPFKNSDPELAKLIDAAYAATGDAQDDALQEVNKYVVDQAWFAPWDAVESAAITADGIDVTPVPGVSVPPLSAYQPAS